MQRSIFLSTLRLIPPQKRKKGVIIVMLLVFTTLLELIGIGTIFTSTLFLLRPEQLNHPLILQVYQAANVNDPRMLAVCFLVFITIFLALKGYITTRITWQKASYAYGLADELASQGIRSMYHMPYTHYQNLNFTDEMNRISNIPITFANNFIIPLGTILAEALIVLALFCIVCFYDLKIFILLTFVIAPLLLLFKLKRKQSANTSEAIKQNYPRLLKETLEAIEGFPEIKTFRKESYFIQKFNNAFRSMSEIFTYDHTLNTSTTRLSELIAGFTICTLVGYIIFTEKTAGATIVLLTLYGAASFRVIPAANRIFTSFMQMKRNAYVIEELERITQSKSPDAITNRKRNFQNVIVLDKICFQHHDKRAVFYDMSLTINKGEKLLITGRSGMGKTTLLLLLMGFVKKDSGIISIDGETLGTDELLNFKNIVGYVPQNPYILDASIRKNIAFGIPHENVDNLKLNQVIEDLRLSTWIENLPNQLDTVIGEKGIKISGGQRQRIALARALYHDAEILLLDEVTNQLDSQSEDEVISIFQSPRFKNVTVVLVTHHLEKWMSFGTHYVLEDGTFKNISANVSANYE